ncbi:MAG: sodium-dependent phosphate transporter [Clostridiales bacterium]|nr:MAG: sodium-dependent phosphate transporter [Clostridiales bacterium]
MDLTILIKVIAGLGLFLFGMQLMGTALQKVAGNKLKGFVNVITKNRFFAATVGMIITMIIQSSSATSVMVVGFVNAGIMTLKQAVGVIMGANVGTTITGQMVSIDIVKYAPIFLAIGLIVSATSESPRRKNISQILIGVGILFIGMGYLKEAVRPLREVAAFKDALISWGQNPIKGVLIGFAVTVILQSSSATIGILIALAAEGLIPFETALYILYGDNIGTCTTAIISSIGSSKNAKRVAVMHLSFNIIGTLLFIFILQIPLTIFVKNISNGNLAWEVANAHTFFNIANLIIQLPLAGVLIKISKLLIRSGDEKEGENHLDPRILMTPSIALKNTLIETSAMAEKALSCFEKSYKAVTERNNKYVKEAFNIEVEVNKSEKMILQYLQDLSKTDLSNQDMLITDELFSTVNDIERIGDHSENIAELADEYLDKSSELDKDTLKDLSVVYEKTHLALSKSIEAFSNGDIEMAKKVKGIEKEIDVLEQEGRKRHIKRMNKGKANVDSGVIYLDILSNFERISDHCKNICQSVIALGGNFKAD